MMKVEHVAIIGGGFSGLLLAINLLRHGGVTVVERRPDQLGREPAVRSGRSSLCPIAGDKSGRLLARSRVRIGSKRTACNRLIYFLKS